MIKFFLNLVTTFRQFFLKTSYGYNSPALGAMDHTEESRQGIELVKEDKNKEALKFFLKLADTGNSSGYVNAGIISEFIFENDKEAIRLYKISAEMKNSVGMYNYGTLLYFLEKDTIQAYSLFLCSAKLGYKLAKNNVDHMKNTNIISTDEIKRAELLAEDC